MIAAESHEHRQRGDRRRVGERAGDDAGHPRPGRRPGARSPPPAGRDDPRAGTGRSAPPGSPAARARCARRPDDGVVLTRRGPGKQTNDSTARGAVDSVCSRLFNLSNA
ncbi:hypothetical protein HBB16_03145 [Pseudonocardia sp. MCCB 268]|nr:hypothetical protein [Pseudonocardia cytotoxica]